MVTEDEKDLSYMVRKVKDHYNNAGINIRKSNEIGIQFCEYKSEVQYSDLTLNNTAMNVIT